MGLHFYQSQGYLCPKEKKTVKCYSENWPQCSSNDLERAWRRLQTESGSSLSYCTLSRWRHTIVAKTRFSFRQEEVPSSETSKFTVAIYDVAFSSLKPNLFTGFSTFYSPLGKRVLAPGKRQLAPWKTTTCPLENDYFPPGKRLLAPWKTSRREPLKRSCALQSFSIFQHNQVQGNRDTVSL